ncbi:multiple sugar transport system permease protein [Microbacterium keratanolyticum]|uniref:Sugar ABC transporter permease n=2 Tax=Microbacterium keratanolyticum TaxID=67574 RepID=A0A9W6HQK9_9MICO|nr:multiple sugar transport system permease protein [Microbacterium keratanolyticum]GLK01107.1 sugar ABC transporter permease [Microbacterium keratanolyticum]
MKTETVRTGADGEGSATQLIVTGSTDPRPMRITRTAGSRVRSVLKHVGLSLLGLLMLYPLLWMLVSSFRPTEDIFSSPGLSLEGFTLENYTLGWDALSHPFGRYLLNSAVVVLGAIVGNLISCSLAAYAFARLTFRGSKWMFGLMLLTIMLPLQVIIVPQYIMFNSVGWVNTVLPLIIPKLFATDAFFIFLMVQFIRGLPRELDEAARIDGCGHFRTFTQILLPLMTPALATTAIFTFIWTWNDFFSQVIYLTSPESYTVQPALRAFLDSQGQSSWGPLFAMSIVSIIPVFLAFLFGQKYLVRGIATTGMK